eukprot:6200571-Pleurochrysis_carterae.AAC.2
MACLLKHSYPVRGSRLGTLQALKQQMLTHAIKTARIRSIANRDLKVGAIDSAHDRKQKLQ